MNVTNRGAYLTRAAVLLLLLIGATTASAGRIDPDKGLNNAADRMMDIMCDMKKIGTLAINDYYQWTSGALAGMPPTIPFTPQNPGLDATDPKYQNRGGARITSNFTQTDPMVKCEFRWLNGVMSGVGTIGTPPYLDPTTRDDGLPFYWTEPENAAANDGAGGTQFIDIPSQAKTNAGNSINFEAAFVAVDLANKKLYYLKGFTWGYSLAAGPTVNLNNFAWKTAPSAGLTGLVTGWDGSSTAPYAGDGTPDGWMWTNTCPCTMIPEPGTVVLLLIGVAVFRGRRRN